MDDTSPTEDVKPGGPAGPVPRSIGPNRILEHIGEGGFGVVYLAEQTEPVRRRVALKLIKPGMDSKAVIARFTAERQALALMDHPNVAKVLDAGTTDRGLPYFVMEHVRGVPITEHCDRQRLTIDQRLALFIDVCNAIQHAHHKGVIHRDIKPSNILVEYIDGRSIPKVIDFGVAKALHQPLTDATIFTQHGQLIGTPEYMSPEQAEMSHQDIDTRTDVYSLGVLLYELVTGTLPFDQRALRAVALAEVHRIIREVEPPKPSTRLSKLPDSVATTLAEISKARHTDPQALTRTLRSDLDWVVMRALEKNRERRYDTANALALEIRRFLDDEPVLAGPPSAAYRFRKFAKRNRALVSTAAIVLVLLAAGLAGTSYGLVAARRAQDQLAGELEAKVALSEFLTSMLAAPDPWGHDESSDFETTDSMTGLMTAAASSARERFREQPELLMEVLAAISGTLAGLEEDAEAERIAAEIVDISTETLGPDHPETISARTCLAWAIHDRADYERSAQMFDQIVDDASRSLGNEHPQTIRARMFLSDLLRHLGEYERSEQVARDAIGHASNSPDFETHHLITLKRFLARTLQDAGLYDEGERAFHDVQAQAETTLGRDHPVTIKIATDLGYFYRAQNRWADMLAWRERAAEDSRRAFGPDHLRTLDAALAYGWSLVRVGQHAEGLQTMERTLESLEGMLGSDHPTTRRALNDIMWSNWRAGNRDTALAIAQTYEDSLQSSGIPTERSKFGEWRQLITSLRDFGQTERAEVCAIEAVDAAERALGKNDRDTLVLANILAHLRITLGKYDEAERGLTRVLDRRRDLLGASHPDTLITLADLIVLYTEAERPHDVTRVVDRLLNSLADAKPIVANRVNELSVVVRDQGLLEDAHRLASAALALTRQSLGPEHWRAINIESNLARIRLRAGDAEEAEAAWVSVLQRRNEVLGPSHPSTRHTMRDLLTLFLEDQRIDDAMSLLESQHNRLRDEFERDPDRIECLKAIAINLSHTRDTLERLGLPAHDLPARLLEAGLEVASHPQAGPSDLNAAAWLLLTIEPESRRDPARALALVRRACTPRDRATANSLDTLALAQHMTGDHAAAIETQRLAIERLPADSPFLQQFNEMLDTFEAAADAGARGAHDSSKPISAPSKSGD